MAGPLAPDLIKAAILSLAAVTPVSEPVIAPISQIARQVCFAHAVTTLDELNEEPVSLSAQTEASKTADPSLPAIGTAATAEGGGKWDWQQQQQQTESEDGVMDSNAPPRSLINATSLNQQRKLADHGLDLLAHLLDK